MAETWENSGPNIGKRMFYRAPSLAPSRTSSEG